MSISNYKNEKNPDDLFSQFDQDVLATWEDAFKEDSEIKWSEHKVKEYLPFVRKALPFIANNQSLFGLSIICLNDSYDNEEEIIRYATKPLVTAEILTEQEISKIIEVFKHMSLSVSSVFSQGYGSFKKFFEVEGTKYEIYTDNYRGYKDLNIRYLP